MKRNYSEEEQMDVEEEVEDNYRRLLDDLWRKGYQLVGEEESQQNPMNNPITKEELEAFYVRMKAIRDELNAVKSKVHDLVSRGDATKELSRWRSFTSFTHPLRHLPRQLMAKCAEMDTPVPFLCTQAYCKFLQIVAAHPALLLEQPTSKPEEIPPKLKQLDLNGDKAKQRIFHSLHLCEAPGAFVLALKHSFADKGIELDWRMNSLNANNPCSTAESSSSSSSSIFVDDQFINNENAWRMAFGWDGSGDIFQWDREYSQKLTAPDSGGKFHLVTGDGGIDCTDEPQDQESRTRPLIQQQFHIAVDCVCPGGNLLLKAYTFFEPETIDLLATICASFANVNCLKPPSSKPGNSEIYLLCIGFLGQPQSQLVLTREFLQRVEECARFFASHQMHFIQFNLRTFRRLSQSERTKMELQKCMAQGVMAQFLWERIQRAIVMEQHKDGKTE